MIRGSVPQEDTEILNVEVPKNIESKYMKQNLIELQGEIEKPIIVGDFSVPIFAADGSSMQKISKDIVE